MTDSQPSPPYLDYIKHWIGTKADVRQKIGDSPRLLSTSDEATLQIHEYGQVGRNLTERMQNRLLHKQRLVYFTLEDERKNAFALVPANCYVVLFTTGLIERLASVGGQAAVCVKECLDLPTESGPLLKSVWSTLLPTQENFEAFGALVTHAAFAFLVHHELAHLILGHEAQWKRLPASANSQSTDIETISHFSEEEFLASGSAANTSGNHGNQALELDADIHALQYTKGYLDGLRRNLQVRGKHIEPFDALWRDVLNSRIGMQYVLASASTLALVSLVPGEAEQKPASFGAGSHPKLSIRLLAAIRAHFALTSDEGGDSVNLVSTEALAFVLALIGILRVEKQTLEVRKRGESLTEGNLASVSANAIYEGYGLEISSDEIDRLKSHVDSLAADMRSISSRLSHLARADTKDRFDWYSVVNETG